MLQINVLYHQAVNTTSQGGSGGSVHRSESSSQDHTDLSRVSSENISAEQVNSDFIDVFTTSCGSILGRSD